MLTEDGEYDLNPGFLFVTGPNVKHEQQPLFPDSMAEYCIYIEVKKKKETSGEMMDILISHPFLFARDDGKILKLVGELFDELNHKYIGYEQQAEALFSMILVHMMRCFMQRHGLQKLLPPAKASKNAALSEQTRSTLIENAFLSDYRTLTLTELAETLHLSRRQTERLVMKLYGKTFYQKKLEAQMSAASLMLKNSSLSISAVSEAAGYSTQEYFSNAFRKFYGCSPREYRKSTSHDTI